MLAHLGNPPASGFKATEQLTGRFRLVRWSHQSLKLADSSDESLVHGVCFCSLI
jgi:hypothetical protein